MSEPGRSVLVVDARGARCPRPILDLARAVASATATTSDPLEVELLSTDPATGPDVRAWCRMRGHRFDSSADRGDHMAYRLVVSGQPSGVQST